MRVATYVQLAGTLIHRIRKFSKKKFFVAFTSVLVIPICASLLVNVNIVVSFGLTRYVAY